MQKEENILHLVEVTPLFHQQVMAFRESFGPGPIHGGFGLKEANNFKEWYQFIDQCKREETAPADFVPASSYLLLNHQEMVGIANIRHRLNPELAKEGGHIGYSIAPNYRGHGFGKALLDLCLKEAKKLGLESVMLVVDEANTPSQAVVKANGGQFKDQVKNKAGQVVNRYWIDLT